MGTGADSVKAYSAVLHKKPNDAEALAALEALLKDDSVRAEAARALIPAYEAVKEHRKLVAALDLVAEMTQDQLERVLALQQAAHVHLHHLRQPELAFAAQKRYLSLYLMRTDIVAAHRHRLVGYSTGKGCIRFPTTAPSDLDLVADLVRATGASSGSVC